jgi:ferric-dicitrate binding protein FerR (iron transport regulator)
MYSVEILLLDDGFVDYCLNHNSPHKIHWEAVITAHPEQYHIFEEARAVIISLGGGLPAREIEGEIEKVKQQILSGDHDITPPEQPGHDFSEALYVNNNGRLRSSSLPRIIIYSAAACVFLFCGIMFLKPAASSTQNAYAANPARYSSLPGKRADVKLPDGTVVILNSNSTITLDKNFNVHNRSLQLSGEAFFKVAKDASRPFIVKSNDFATTAIGTQFYVYARNANEAYKVDLLEGKVRAGNRKDELILAPGEEVIWNEEHSPFSKSIFDTTQLRQWLTGKISFNKTPVYTAVQALEKWYGVNIEVKKKAMLDQAISGDYDNASLDDILKIICFTFSCNYTYNDNTITIE